MNICLVISTSFSFLQAVEDAVHLAFEPWRIAEAVSYVQADEILSEEYVQIVLIDETSMAASPEKFLEKSCAQYQSTWMIAVGDTAYPGSQHLKFPIRPQTLNFFLQNQKDKVIDDSKWMQQYMSNIYPILLKHIWTGLLNGWIAPDSTMIMMAANGVNIPNLEKMYIQPILVKTVHESRQDVSRDASMQDHIFLNELLLEKLLEDDNAGATLDRFAQKWAVILYIEQYPCKREELICRCSNASTSAKERGWQLSFYIGQKILPENLQKQWQKLESAAAEDVGYSSRIVCVNSMASHQSAPELDMEDIRLLMDQKEWDEVYVHMETCVLDLAKQDMLDFQWLTQCRDDFLQEIYHVIQLHGIPAKEVLTGRLMGEDFMRSTSGVQIFLGWIKKILDRISAFLEKGEPDTIVKKAQKYILQNLNTDLTRDDIAAHVFVSSGYLGKLFKKEVQMNLSQYIFYERMQLAAKMLEQTDQYVTAIAMQVGFSNFPYFSTQFKKYSGYTPVEYRKLARTGELRSET